MTDKAERCLAVAFVSFVILCVALFWMSVKAYAHDPSHSELDGWYAGLMQPDRPTSPCCGKTDAYWCDDYHVKTGPDGSKDLYCTVNDERDIPGRPEIPNGTEVFIPPYKLKWDEGNPTGHAILFGSPIRSYGADGSEKAVGVTVYCYVMNGGV